MQRILNQKKLEELFLENRKDCNKVYSKDVSIVASTYTNMSKSRLDKILRSLSRKVNEKIYKKNFKKISPDKQIVFYKFHEQVENNTHCHIVIEYPIKLNRFRVFDLMKEIFELLDDRQLIATEKIYDFNPPKDVPRFTMHISNVKTSNERNIHYKTKKYNQEENLEIY